ncbi:MAG: branched-chain amino acid ABC transporter permease, partial [Elainellaceae cyanobacterium]
RHLYGRPLETLLATCVFSLILIQFVRSVNAAMVLGLLLFAVLFVGGRLALKKAATPDWASPILLVVSAAIALVAGRLLNASEQDWLTRPWFGPRNIDVTAPGWLQGGVSVGATLQFPYARLFIIVLTVICLLGIYWFLNRSVWGLRIRAVTQNRDMSACLGIPTKTVDALTFALGSGLAGIAGSAITLLGSVGPNLGGNYIVDAFMVVVVGGVGNIFGSVLAAFAIGTLSYLIGSGTIPLVLSGLEAGGAVQPLLDFFNFFAQSSMAKVMVFALIIAFLQVRPGGLFPQKGRTAEA